GVSWILTAKIVFFLLFVLGGNTARDNIYRWLVLTPSSLLSGHLWKLATTCLVDVTATRDVVIFSLVFDVLLLWFFVPLLESYLGTKRLFALLALTCLAGNLASALVGLALAPLLPVSGLSPFIYGSIAAFGTVFANQPVQFLFLRPVSARSFTLVVVALLLLLTLLGQQWVSGTGCFVAMGVAWVYASGKGFFAQLLDRFHRWQWRRQHRVLKGGASGDNGRDRDHDRWIN
ncbi:MAG: rhomboid family intramembrane serine protease, partial [Pseudomonadota bacterium]